MPTKIDWQLVVNLIGLAMACFVLPLVRWVHKIKTNELHHIAESQARIEQAVVGISDKLDRHIEWHLEKRD